MDQIFQTSLTRNAALLNEAATNLQDAAAQAGAEDSDVARGATEYAIGTARRALAMIAACHTLQGEMRSPESRS